MELKDFISETLIHIVDGVKEAQKHAKENDAKINPINLQLQKSGNKPIYSDGRGINFAQVIDFDVALTVTDEKKGKSGVGVFVGPIGIGGQIQSDKINSSISRISFSVPVFLPQQEK